MPELLTRADPTELRSLELPAASLQVREATQDEPRSVEGIAVPWDQTISVWGERERFARGAFGDFNGAGAALYANHGHVRGELPIGRVVASEDRPEGQWFRATISHTARGDETYTLLRDGSLSGLSIGFLPVAMRNDSDDAGDITTYTEAVFREVSVVGFPAYSQAAVTAVRHQPPPIPAPTNRSSMTPEELAALQAELTELRSAQDTLTRSLAVLQADAPSALGRSHVLPYSSLAEFVRALAVPSARPQGFGTAAEAAAELGAAFREAAEQEMALRAYTGATTANLGSALQPAWLARDIRLVEQNRDIFNLFSSEPLPAEGMSVAYPKFNAKTGDVAEQVQQGDTLAYLAMTITSDSADVKTYGGYSELSRQVIERAGLSFLAKVLRMQIISYAKITNGIIRTRLTAGTGYNPLTLTGGATPTPKNVIEAGIDGAGLVHDNSVGLEAEFWLMSLAQFKSVALLMDNNNRPIFELNGDGSNTAGTVRLDALNSAAASAVGIKGLMPFKVDRGLTGRYSYMCSSEAITTLESPGAPFNLEDENILNLTKQFSLYGYLASTLNDPKGIVKVDHGATFAA